MINLMRIIEELLSSGAPEITAGSVDEVVRKLPQLRAEFASMEEVRIDLTLPLDFLSQILEDFTAGLCRDLPYHAVADITFALKYLDQDVDLIPDSLPDVGLADDAAVINRVLAKHAPILKEYAVERGFVWDDLLTI